MRILTALGCISFVCGLIFILVDAVTGHAGVEVNGCIADKQYRPAYTTTSISIDDEGHVEVEETVHPEQFILRIVTPDGSFSTNVTPVIFHQARPYQYVTCVKRFGRWTGWSYGWSLHSLQPPVLKPESP
jgi:hypothetical protein